MERARTILIVDDDQVQAETLARVLALEGYGTAVTTSGEAALARVARGGIDLVLSDLKMPGMDGMELFRRLKERAPGLPLMIVTAHGTIESALGAVREGVVDFVQKPVYADELVHRLRTVLRAGDLRRENERLRERLTHRERGDAMIGQSAALERLREEIARVARTEATVLILGESGTGKELVADALHYGSARAEGPLIKLNCAAIPETLLEDEMFGHERGAYTGADDRRKGRFEMAHRGTLFLDEIGEMPLALQAKLLRLLQERTFERLGGNESIETDTRVICASNQDLGARVGQGAFREDLYYRINVVPLTVPPLRQREGDVELLARHFAREAGARNGRPIEDVARAAIEKLENHAWPGNVRELRNAIERAVILGTGPVLTADQIRFSAGLDAGRRPGSGHGGGLVERLMSSEISFEEFERSLLVLALERTRGNQSKAARMLGMTRRTLQYRIEKFGIDTARMRD